MRSRKKAKAYLSAATRAICELMCTLGISKKSAGTILARALEEGFTGSIAESKHASRIVKLADVCARWHFENAYTDPAGRPRPLSWNGRSGSLLELAKRVVGKKEALEVVQELVSRRLLKRVSRGRWLPKSKVVAPVGPNDSQVLRSATMIERLLRTILYNSERRYKGDVLLEVMARVPQLPSDKLRSFRRFAKAQGVSFIQTIDDWLESRNIRQPNKRSAKTREVGVVAFAFSTPQRKSR